MNIFGLAMCLMFALAGIALLPYPGMQNDEVLFGYVIYEPRYLAHSISVFGRAVPLMLINYLGALKAGLYAVLFKVWEPSLWSVRLPVIAGGAATVWLFFVFLRDWLGSRAALAGAALLATDTIFLLTTTFDWGPVALQHLLLLGGLVALYKFSCMERKPGKNWRRDGLLALGFFCFGLGLWDKTLFFWALSGVSVAALAVYPREMFRFITARNAGIALFAISLGALPLIVYNVRHGWPTLGNAKFTTGDLPRKVEAMRISLDGSALFGYLARTGKDERRYQPPTKFERVSLFISQAAKGPRVNFFLPALALALLLFPLIWRTPAARAFIFAAIAIIVAWAQMLFTREVGGSAHHTVLLWPFPHLAVAAAFSGASYRLGRPGLAVLTATVIVVCVANLLVVNEYLACFVRHGSGPLWTDALDKLTATLKREQAFKVVVIDWGIMDSVRMSGRGTLPLETAEGIAMTAELNEAERKRFKSMLSQPRTLFVNHFRGVEINEGAGAQFQRHAATMGFQKEVVAVIRDAHQRAIFEVFRFCPEAGFPGTTWERITSVRARPS